MVETNQDPDLKNKEKFVKDIEGIIDDRFSEKIVEINLNGTQTTIRKINKEEKNIEVIRGCEIYKITVRKGYYNPK